MPSRVFRSASRSRGMIAGDQRLAADLRSILGTTQAEKRSLYVGEDAGSRGAVMSWVGWAFLDVHETPSGPSPALPRFACHAVADHSGAGLTLARG
jgi:hypothetical protein